MVNKAFVASLCLVATFFSLSHSRARATQNEMYFATALTDNVKMSSVLATRVRVEMMSNAELSWVGYELDTMVKSHCKQELFYTESIGSDIISKLRQAGIAYCVIPFISSTGLDTIPAHLEVQPSLGTVRLEKVWEQDGFDSTVVYAVIVDVNTNRIIKRDQATLRTETCDDDFVICVRDAITEMSSLSDYKMTKKSVQPVTADTRKKAISLNSAGQGLFIFGSILTLAEAGIVVSGNTESARTAGLTLYIMGHTGLITTGLSTIPMNKSVKLMYGQGIPGAGKGWALYGASLGMTTTGLLLTRNGADADNLPMIITGICSICAGEALTIPAWLSFRKVKKKASRMIERLTSGKIDSNN